MTSSLRGKTVDWIKFEIQGKISRKIYKICVLLGGWYAVISWIYYYNELMDLWHLSLQATSDTEMKVCHVNFQIFVHRNLLDSYHSLSSNDSFYRDHPKKNALSVVFCNL